jgi:hypothetical protein
MLLENYCVQRTERARGNAVSLAQICEKLFTGEHNPFLIVQAAVIQ